MAGVFKTYDIRGIYGKGIDTVLAYKLGRAFARWSNKDTSVSYTHLTLPTN